MTAVDKARLLYGGLLLLNAGQVGPTVVGRGLDRRERVAARLIGARHVGLACAQFGGTGFDVAHAVSMVGLACFSRRYRRSALNSAAVAASWAFGGQWRQRRPPPARRSRPRWYR